MTTCYMYKITIIIINIYITFTKLIYLSEHGIDRKF